MVGVEEVIGDDLIIVVGSARKRAAAVAVTQGPNARHFCLQLIVNQYVAALVGCNPSLVETIRHLMFVFEDLLLLDISAVKEVLAKVDRKILTVALKGTSEQMKNHMLQAMSQRGAEMMREDMDALGAVKIKEVESAQQQIIAVVRQMEAEGTVNLGAGGGEQYVS